MIGDAAIILCRLFAGHQLDLGKGILMKFNKLKVGECERLLLEVAGAINAWNDVFCLESPDTQSENYKLFRDHGEAIQQTAALIGESGASCESLVLETCSEYEHDQVLRAINGLPSGGAPRMKLWLLSNVYSAGKLSKGLAEHAIRSLGYSAKRKSWGLTHNESLTTRIWVHCRSGLEASLQLGERNVKGAGLLLSHARPVLGLSKEIANHVICDEVRRLKKTGLTRPQIRIALNKTHAEQIELVSPSSAGTWPSDSTITRLINGQ